MNGYEHFQFSEQSEGPDEFRAGHQGNAVVGPPTSHRTSTPIHRQGEHYVVVDTDRSIPHDTSAALGREVQPPADWEARMEKMFSSMTQAFASALGQVVPAPTVHQRSFNRKVRRHREPYPGHYPTLRGEAEEWRERSRFHHEKDVPL